jgi:transcriptional regulator with XRE-family HTH domain
VASALGRLIVARQRELGLRLADVAELSGTTEATVSRWVHGRSRPVPSNLRRLAEALQVPYARLVDATGAAG